PNYPKSHLLAASGVAALLSLALLVFPSREVEAKKTFIDLKLESASEQNFSAPDSNSSASEDSPFARTGATGSNAETNDQRTPEEAIAEAKEAEIDALSKTVVVANGDTLSTVFAKVG